MESAGYSMNALLRTLVYAAYLGVILFFLGDVECDVRYAKQNANKMINCA